MKSTGHVDHTLAAAIVQSAVQEAFKTAAAKTRGLRGRTLLIQPTACIPGCVLFLGHIIDEAQEGTGFGAGCVGDDSRCHQAAAAVAAYANGAWSVPLQCALGNSSIGSSSSSSSVSIGNNIVHLTYTDLEEFQRLMAGGGLADDLAAAAEEVLDMMGGSGGEGLGGLHGGLVASWGDEVKVRLVEMPMKESPGVLGTSVTSGRGRDTVGVQGGRVLAGAVGMAMKESSGVLGTGSNGRDSGRDIGAVWDRGVPGTSNSSGRGTDAGAVGDGGVLDRAAVIRVVLSHRGEVLQDEDKQLLHRSLCEVANGKVSATTATTTAATAAAAAGSDIYAVASVMRSADHYLRLEMPSTISSSSSSRRNDAAAALNLTLLPHHKAAEGMSADPYNGAPLGYASVLLLPPAVADEVITWVQQQQLRVGELAPLLQDMAFVLDTREMLLAVTSGSPLSLVSSPEVSPGDTGPDIAVVSSRATAAAGSLVECFTAVRLPAAADLFAVVRQQLLRAGLEWQPLAAGALPSREESAAAAAAAAAQPGKPPSAAGDDTAAADGGEYCFRTLGCGADPAVAPGTAAATAAAAAAGESPTGGCCGCTSELTQVHNTPTPSSSSSRKFKPHQKKHQVSSSSSSPTEAAAAAAADRTAVVPKLSAEDLNAAAAGGWGSAKLCWRGFQIPETEAQYLRFRASHFRWMDWVSRVYVFCVVTMIGYRHLQQFDGQLHMLHGK